MVRLGHCVPPGTPPIGPLNVVLNVVLNVPPSAPHWVLLRGLTREARHWGAFAQQLQATQAGSRITLLDLPGNGACHHLPSPTQVSGMLDFVRSRLPGHPAPYRVIGMSLGGMVATAWAQQHPNEVARLVLVNSSMRPFSTVFQRLRPQNWLALLRLALHWQDAEAAEQAIHQLTCHWQGGLPLELAQWAAIRREAPVSGPNALRQLVAAARFTAAARPPPCPVLLLSSDADRLVNPVCSRQLAQAWRSPRLQHQQHPWAGHDLPHDDPRWLCQAITNWLCEPAEPQDPSTSAQ